MKEQREGGFLISKIHQLSNRLLNKKLKEHGLDQLNSAQGRIMFVLWREDNISINDLSRKTQLSKSTLTSMLDRLEGAGFLIRKPSNRDRRKILIKLSEYGKELQHKYIEISKQMTFLFYNTFSEEEIDDFENFLRKILDNLLKMAD